MWACALMPAARWVVEKVMTDIGLRIPGALIGGADLVKRSQQCAAMAERPATFSSGAAEHWLGEGL